jgi:hypothetical protein
MEDVQAVPETQAAELRARGFLSEWRSGSLAWACVAKLLSASADARSKRRLPGCSKTLSLSLASWLGSPCRKCQAQTAWRAVAAQRKSYDFPRLGDLITWLENQKPARAAKLHNHRAHCVKNAAE